MNRLKVLLILLLCAAIPLQSLAGLAEAGPSCRESQSAAMPEIEEGMNEAMDCCDSALPGGKACECSQAGQRCAGNVPVFGIPVSAASLPASGSFPHFVTAHSLFLPDPVSGIWRPPLPV